MLKKLLATVVVTASALLAHPTAGWSLEIGPLLDTCPQHDPAYQQIRNDFQLRRNGVLVTDVPCVEPLSTFPTAQYTNELVVLQSLRAVLYMDLGNVQLPWAPGMRLYDWLKSKGAGIDIVDNSGSWCCEDIGGKPFFVYGATKDSDREFDRSWQGITGKIGLFAHELRHRDGFPHVGCCPVGGYGCDQTYDENNLAPYGIQWWLEAHWLDGGLYSGFSCLAPAQASQIAAWHLDAANSAFNDRFCDTRPPILTMPAQPGGLCRSQPDKIDVVIALDLSGSFADDLDAFKAEAPALIAKLTAGRDARIGLVTFQDYPISPFGLASMGDKAYDRVLDLTSNSQQVLSTIAAIPTPIAGVGGDDPQSQLSVLYQLATGAGEDLSAVGHPGASIPAGQQVNFRAGATKLVLLWTDAPFHLPGDAGAIPYPGPTWNQTVNALMALDPARALGMAAGDTAMDNLRTMATATGALAPEGGVDCDGDGVMDIAAGAPLVCLANQGLGVGGAIDALVTGAVAAATPVALCRDVTVPASAEDCGVVASVDNGSFDPDGGPVTLMQSPSGPYRAGQNPVTLTVTDSSGSHRSCTATVTVVDQTGPVITLAENPPKPVCAMAGEIVSFAPATALDACASQVPVTGRVVSSSNPAVHVPVPLNNGTVPLPVGTYTIEWRASDGNGNQSTRQQSVTVVPAFYALSQLEVRDRVRLAAGSGYASIASGGTSTTTLGVEAATGDLWSLGSVTVADRARITGQIRAKGSITLANQVVVTGGTVPRSTPPLPSAPWVDVTYPPPSLGSVAVGPQSTRPLNPGSYAAVTVYSQATLTLAPGTYYFTSLTLEPQATIKALGPVTLYVKDALVDRGTFADFQGSKVAYTGTNPVVLESPLNTKLWAGSASVTVRAALTGQLVARNISVDAGLVLSCVR